MSAKISQALMDRVQKRLTAGDKGCWLWTGAKTPHGYGVIGQGRKKVLYTHRIAYAFHKGPIQPGSYVCHSCDTPACCNPEHLWVGSPRDNGLDMSRKGRSSSQLTLADVAQIRAALSERQSQRRIAAKFGVTQATISNISLGRTWQ